MPALFSGIPGVPPVVIGCAFGVAFWWLATAAGHRLLRVLRVQLGNLDVWEHAFLAAAAGAGALQLPAYLLGAARLLQPSTLRLAVGLLALSLLPDLKRVALAGKRAVRGLDYRKLTFVDVAWAIPFCALMGILLVHASVLHNFGDDDGYHLTAPKRWLMAGALVYLPSFLTTNASMGFEMLYAIALATGGAAAAKLLHFAAGLFCLLGVVLLARRIASARVGLVAVSVLLIASPICNVPELLTMAYVDFAALWMVLASVLAWLAWREHPSTPALVCLGLYIGLAGSFKTTTLIVGAAWLPVIALDAHRLGWSRLKTVAILVELGLVALVPILPWFVRNGVTTGNPFYPMLSSLIPTQDWPPELARVFSRYVHYYSWGIAAGARWSDTVRREILVACVLLVATAVAALVKLTKQPILRSLFLFSGAFTLASMMLSALIFRYWLPGIVCGVLTGTAVAVGRLSPVAQARIAVAAMAAALAVRAKHEAKHERYVELIKDLRVASGLSTADVEFRNDPAWRMWAHINATTPADARILIASFYPTFGASSFGAFSVDRTTYVTDSHLQSFIQLNDWSAFVHSVQSTKIGYLVVSDQLFCAGRIGLSSPAVDNEYPFSRRLGELFGKKIAQFGSLQLYQLSGPACPAGMHCSAAAN